jgi:hypothetical protein
MAETLGSLCDKLTVVRLKIYHMDCNNPTLRDLAIQETHLMSEIDRFITDAISGKIPYSQLHFASHKIYKKEGNEIHQIPGKDIGWAIAELARINCNLWHEQENVYDFENIVGCDAKNEVIKKVAILNLQRNQCIEKVDILFKEMIK